jgi:hypothetical protein
MRLSFSGLETLFRFALQPQAMRLTRERGHLVDDEIRQPALRLEWHSDLPRQVIEKPLVRDAETNGQPVRCR